MTAISRSIVAIAAVFIGLAAAGASAGDAILTVSGRIANAPAGGVVTFDRAALEALPRVSFRTTTIWTEGEHEFSGVSLHELLKAVGAEGSALKALALNNYSVSIPVSDAVEGGPIIADRMDGAEMSVRDKGPLWVIYPYDGNPDYRTETVYSRSIWQLDRLEVLD